MCWLTWSRSHGLRSIPIISTSTTRRGSASPPSLEQHPLQFEYQNPRPTIDPTYYVLT
uniref:Uncharacterized protein n=1 Tax=Picea glauca TaxID=3330 RepID=A0A101LVX9_PICGL|nr:hypothetical protein ABT39_MTgene1828 [Picea glauca]